MSVRVLRSREALSDTAIRPSVPWRSCLGYRHSGCLQLSHRRPPEICRLRTRPRTDVDLPRFLPPSNCHRRGAYRLAVSLRGDTLLVLGELSLLICSLSRNDKSVSILVRRITTSTLAACAVCCPRQCCRPAERRCCLLAVDRRDRQTERRTPDLYIDVCRISCGQRQ